MHNITNIRAFDGELPRLGQRVYVDPAALVVGKVQMGDDASIWPFAVARGDVNRIEIGAATNIQDGSVLHVTHDGRYTPGGRALLIGAGVTVGHGVILHACTVGDYCLIGMGATVLDNVEIADHAMVGAGSLVTGGTSIPSGTLWRGSPARYARDLSEREMEQLEYSARHYVRLKDKYLNPGDGGG